MNSFSPIFIVGVPRSGTTMLAAALARHPNIAIPPETHLFSEYLPKRNQSEPITPDVIEQFVIHPRVKDMQLSASDITPEFGKYESNYSGLFQCALEVYAKKSGKSRVGEKSPTHLKHVDKIIQWYPDAKIICIVRDGRDVVKSLIAAPWIHNNLIKHCIMWREQMQLIDELAGRYSNSVLVIKYEELLLDPSRVIAAICEFCSEKYTDQMLQPQKTSVVPAWEKGWKGNADSNFDPSKIAMWRSTCSDKELMLMQFIMGEQLLKWGYPIERTSSFKDNLYAMALTFPYRKVFRDLWAIVRLYFPAKYHGLAAQVRSGQVDSLLNGDKKSPP